MKVKKATLGESMEFVLIVIGVIVFCGYVLPLSV